MTPSDILNTLQNDGAALELSLRGANLTDQHRELVKAHRLELIDTLAQANTLPPLPWQLERLLKAASSNVLETHISGVPDPQRYVMAWGCEYLAGDREEALARLWGVWRVWEGVN